MDICTYLLIYFILKKDITHCCLLYVSYIVLLSFGLLSQQNDLLQLIYWCCLCGSWMFAFYFCIYIYIYLIKVANLAVECSMPYKQNVV